MDAINIPADFRHYQREWGIWKENRDAFLEYTIPRVGQESAYDALTELANKDEGTVVLVGESRAGKSWLVSAYMNTKMKEWYNTNVNREARYMTFFEFELALRSAMVKGTMDVLFATLCSYSVLVVDEIGRGKWSDFTATFFENLLINRYGNRKATALATNLNVKELFEMFDLAIIERLKTGKICQVRKLSEK